MPRRLRQFAPGVPLHVTQRGVDRCPTFLADEDYAWYLLALRTASESRRCAVHAYALMGNHVHLLVTPGDVTALPRLMQSVGRRYVRYFNTRYGRTGTLWEGRYRAAGIDSASYFLACCRYIECNPVRAGMCRRPADYRWSSHASNAYGSVDPVITPHPLYLDLGATERSRHEAYRALFSATPSPSTEALIRADTGGRPVLPTSVYQQALSIAAMRAATLTAEVRGCWAG